MQFSTILLFASLALTGFAAPNAKRTVAQVEADIATISTRVGTLDAAIIAFPNTGGSLLAALAIHTDAVNLGSSIDTGTTDVKNTPTPISESDGQTILAAFSALEPKILDSLTQIGNKKAAFTALPIGGIPALVLQDLKNLQTSTLAIEAALIASAPADLKTQATAIKTAIDAGFVTAIAIYS